MTGRNLSTSSNDSVMPARNGHRANNRNKGSLPKDANTRVTGFSRLINEKTMVRDETPMDRAVEALCPQLSSRGEEKSLSDQHPVVEKLLKELVLKMRHNTCHVLLEEAIVITTPDRLVWHRVEARSDLDGAELDVLLPVRRLPGTRVDHDLGEGYASVKINVVRFEDGNAPDMFEYVRSSNGKVMSPSAVASIQQRIMIAASKTLEARYSGAVVVERITEPDEQNTFRMSVSLSEHFLSMSQDELSEEDKDKGKKKKDEDDDDDDEDEEADDEEDVHKERKKKEEEQEEEKVPEEVKFRRLHFRFIPGMNCLSKEKIYFTAQPYAFDSFDGKMDVWRYYYHMRENLILRPVFRADMSRRLRAMAGLVRLCAIEPDLNWVAEDHARQIVLHQVQNEVDDVVKWQRMSLAECLREMFAALRTFASQRKLPHYFIDELNLLAPVCSERLSRAMVRCSMLAKSESALARIANLASQESWGRPVIGPEVQFLPPEPKEDPKEEKKAAKTKTKTKAKKKKV